jgi:uncharacterized protein GlcG (DUF336 family)
MKSRTRSSSRYVLGIVAGLLLITGSVQAQEPGECDDIAAAALGGGTVHSQLLAALAAGLSPGVGLQNDMWATIVDSFGRVCAVVRSGEGAPVGGQWLGSRVISAQKANTANAFSLRAGAGGLVPGLALSTANLWSATQPGGSLFGLQFSNPVDARVAYGDNSLTSGEDGPGAPAYGASDDPMVATFIGGVNVFGGGLALYRFDGELLGAIGVSGDTSCADHVVAWRTRDALGLDSVPAGVSDTGDDNIIFDVTPTNPGKSGFGDFASASGFGHPECGFGERPIAEALPSTHPVSPVE